MAVSEAAGPTGLVQAPVVRLTCSQTHTHTHTHTHRYTHTHSSKHAHDQDAERDSLIISQTENETHIHTHTPTRQAKQHGVCALTYNFFNTHTALNSLLVSLLEDWYIQYICRKHKGEHR